MNKRFSFQLILIALLPFTAWSQSQDAIPKPIPPILSPIPDNSTLTITLSHSDSPAKPLPGHRLMDKLIITKSDTTRVIASVYTDGSKSEIWFYNGYRIEQLPANPYVMITPLPRSGDNQNTDFPHLNWLDTANYTGIENHNGKSCWHFKTRVTLELQHTAFDYSAYIDLKTKMPVAWDFGPDHFDLTSVEKRDASDPLILPKMFADKLKDYQLAESATNAYKKTP